MDFIVLFKRIGKESQTLLCALSFHFAPLREPNQQATSNFLLRALHSQ